MTGATKNRLPPYLTYLQRWILSGTIIGIVSGVGAAAFYFLLKLSSEFFLGFLAGYKPPLPGGEHSSPILGQSGVLPWWALALLPLIGGLISGVIIYSYAPEAEGHGTDAVIASFHRFHGLIRRRVPFIKTIASVITIGSGGSAGREGPIAQIGGGFGSWLTSTLKLSVHDRELMVICGAAGGIGSIFKAPLGGAVFATEVLYRRDFEAEALIPAFVSSVVAYSVFSSFPGVGFIPIFTTPKYVFAHPSELIFYAILGLICGPVARFYIYIFYGLRDGFKKLNIPVHFKPAIGGGMLGILALFVPQVLGMGYGWIQMAIYGQLALTTMLILCFTKIFATSFTISSGGSGGVFAPSLVIGAMLGGVLGTIFKMIFPAIEPGAFVLVGMAAFFAGAAKVPIAALIMVSEMTGDYNLLAPLMIACALSYIISGKWTIYENQTLNRAESPAHRGEYSIDVLEQLKVKDVMTKDVITVSPSATIREFRRLIRTEGHLAYPVLENGQLVGIVTLRDYLKVPPDKMDEVKLRDIMSRKLLTVNEEERLDIALRKIDESGYGHLPVVDPQNLKRLMGILTRKDIIRGHEIARHRSNQEEC